MLQLGTVLQYSYFFCHSRFPLKTVHPFCNFLVVLPPPHPIQSWNSEKILNTHVQRCLWGEGRGWTSMNNYWKTPQKRKSVPRLLSMIVWERGGRKKCNFEGSSSLVKCFFRLLMKDRNWTNRFLAFRSFLDLFEEFARREWCTPEIVLSHSTCFIPKNTLTLNKTHVQKWLSEATSYQHYRVHNKPKKFRQAMKELESWINDKEWGYLAGI